MGRHVPHLFVAGDWDHDKLRLTRDQLHHLEKVLRLSEGAEVSYTNGRGTVGNGSFSGGVIVRDREETVPRPNPITLAVAPPASRDRCRFLVEKLSELGVARLAWLATSRGEGRIPHAAKTTLWSASALEQSRGGWLMEVGADLLSWDDLDRPLVVAVPGGGSEIFEVRTVAIGPEGGLDPAEIPADAASIDLGSTILRVETAAVIAASRFSRPWHGG
ncbi:MAG TPA: 16S rRNA (uracil(1498)-N(3))-methyltransferase [Acidimicrobiia bacterium]|nr:16S rRNA (uracil(1498)-N(3))-methyltransferase [Acidimicrobiia bacterium]